MHSARLRTEDFATPYFAADGQIVPFDISVILGEADHRIANHLALLMGYVRLKTADMDRQRQAPSRESVHALMDGVRAQIAAVAKLHRALVTDCQAGSIDLGEHLREVCAPFASGLCGPVGIIEDFALGCVVRPEQVLPISQVVAEVVTNAFKHACDGAKRGAVLVKCRTDASGSVQIEVIDRGGGFPSGFDPEMDGGFGFRLVRGLSRKLGARIDFRSTTRGVRFCLALPAPTPIQPRIRSRWGEPAPRINGGRGEAQVSPFGNIT